MGAMEEQKSWTPSCAEDNFSLPCLEHIRPHPFVRPDAYDEFLTQLDLLLQHHHDRLVHDLLPHVSAGPAAVQPATSTGTERRTVIAEQPQVEEYFDLNEDEDDDAPEAMTNRASQGRSSQNTTASASSQGTQGFASHGLGSRGVSSDSQGEASHATSSHQSKSVLKKEPSAKSKFSSTFSRAEADKRSLALQTLRRSGGDTLRAAFGRKISTFSKSEADRRHVALVSSSQHLPTPEDEKLKLRKSWYEVKGWCFKIKNFAASHWFEVLMSIVIISNAIFCGWEVEYLAQTRVTQSPVGFHVASIFFVVVFSIELLLRLLAEGKQFFTKKPNWRWNFFDFIIVAVSLLDICVDMENAAASQVPAIRVIRIARVIRVLRVARIMRHFRSLRILVNSVLNTLRSLFWTMALLAIILYMFGILFTQASGEHLLTANRKIPGLQEYYGTVGRSVFTLFKAISGGVDWEIITAPLHELHPAYVGLFLVYFYFTYFAVLNVMTGVFCQTAIESAHHDHDMAAQAHLAARQLYVKRLERLFRQINVNETGKITLQEFEQSMQDEKLKAYFASIDLSVDEAFSLFKLLDSDNSHVLNIDTFVTGCLKLRGAAKSLDIAMMTYETRWNMQRCLKSIHYIEEHLNKVDNILYDTQSGATRSVLDSPREDLSSSEQRLFAI